MCGRFALSILPAQFQRVFGCAPPEGLAARYNVTPDTAIVIVRAGPEGTPEAVFARWGLLGPWMKEANDPGRQINARSETAAEKPMFRDVFRKSRCLIPAMGFYEWQKAGGGPSRPFYIALASGEPFAFAGLWRASRLVDGTVLETCTILTTDAYPSLKPIHHRMPVILPEASQALWLDPPVKDPEFVQALLTPRPEQELVAHEVGRAVNNPRNDGPALVGPVGRQAAAPDLGPKQGSLL
jgi:putative SOS response-associated peptidase YedK